MASDRLLAGGCCALPNPFEQLAFGGVQWRESGLDLLKGLADGGLVTRDPFVEREGVKVERRHALKKGDLADALRGFAADLDRGSVGVRLSL